MTSFPRISNNMMYGLSSNRLTSLQSQLSKTIEHISSGKRILTPSDDPVGAARALDLKQGKSMNTQFASNRGYINDALTLQESTLHSFGSRLQDIHTLMVAAGDGIHGQEQLQVIADEIRAIRDEMVGYANTRDPYGNYIFSGYQVAVEPFSMSVLGDVTYQGDDGQMMIQVDSARYMASTDSGRNIFMGIKGMTASTVTPSRNDLLIDVSITDETALNDYSYEVRFSGDSPVSSYTLWRSDGTNTVQITADGTVVTDANGDPVTDQANPDMNFSYPYTSDNKNTMEVEVDGVKFSISGEVSDGDTVGITPGEPIRTDVFSYINEALDLLENTELGSNGASTNLSLGIGALLDNFTASLDQILTARSDAGTRLKELDNLNAAGETKNLQYTESISELEDLDYYEAISSLYMEQMTLQAAQQTFMTMSGMSLFNIM